MTLLRFVRRCFSSIPSSLYRQGDAKIPPSSAGFGASSALPKQELLPPEVLIQCLPNNIFVTVSKAPGSLLFKLSAGLIGMKDAQKTSQKGAMALVDRLSERLGQLGIRKIRLNFRGVNSTRPLIVSQLRKFDLTVSEVVDSTGLPFNGCRPRKSRRG